MSDEEIMKECKESPVFKSFFKAVCSIADDEIALGAVRILVNEISQGPEIAAEHAAAYLLDHGRPEAAQRIREGRA